MSYFDVTNVTLRLRQRRWPKRRRLRGRRGERRPAPARGTHPARSSQLAGGVPMICERVACRREAITLAIASRRTTPASQSS